MNLIEFKQKLEYLKTIDTDGFKYSLPKINHRPINRIVVFNGKFDYPIKNVGSSLEWDMYQRVLIYVLNKKKV